MKQPDIGTWALRLQASSQRVKVWARDITAPRPQSDHRSDEPSNPIFLLAALTLGIPTLLIFLVVGTNPGIQEGTLATLVMFLVFSAFVIAALFEIKRLADQPSKTDHH